MTAPRLFLSREDAQRLGLSEGGGARCGSMGTFEVSIHPALRAGAAGLTVGSAWLAIGEPVQVNADPDYGPPTPTGLIARG